MDEAGQVDYEIRSDERAIEGAGLKLYRRSVWPTSGMLARLTIVHGYGDHSGRYLHFMRWMGQRGFACDALDLRGQGRAGGRRGFVRSWPEYLDDLRAGLDAPLPFDTSSIPHFVLGHSHGGLVVTIAGEKGILRDRKIRGCVLTSPFIGSMIRVPLPKYVAARAVGMLIPWFPLATGLSAEVMSSDPAMVQDSRVDPLCTRVATPAWFVGQAAAQRQAMARASEFRLPLLVLAAGADTIADAAVSERFVQQAGSSDKTYRVCPSLRHEILREVGREAIFEEIFSWLQARIELEQPV